MAEKVEWIEGLARLLRYLFGKRFKEDALIGQFADDGVLFVGCVPVVQELVERSELLCNRLSRIVLQRLRNELAIRVEILDAFGYDSDRNIPDNVAK